MANLNRVYAIVDNMESAMLRLTSLHPDYHNKRAVLVVQLGAISEEELDNLCMTRPNLVLTRDGQYVAASIVMRHLRPLMGKAKNLPDLVSTAVHRYGAKMREARPFVSSDEDAEAPIIEDDVEEPPMRTPTCSGDEEDKDDG